MAWRYLGKLVPNFLYSNLARGYPWINTYFSVPLVEMHVCSQSA